LNIVLISQDNICSCAFWDINCTCVSYCTCYLYDIAISHHIGLYMCHELLRDTKVEDPNAVLLKG